VAAADWTTFAPKNFLSSASASRFFGSTPRSVRIRAVTAGAEVDAEVVEDVVEGS